MDHDSAQHRRAIASTFGASNDELIFFGQGAELAYAMGEGDASAEERIKSLLGDPGERGLAAARRRVVRRPLGGGGYQAQTIVFSERDRDAASPGLSSEPLSELLQLAASRKGSLPRCSRDSGSASSSMLQSLSGLTAGAVDAERKRAGETAGAPATPAQQLRAAFVQELLLSTLAHPASSLDDGPLDAPLASRPGAAP